MKWLAFAIAALAAIGFDTGLSELLRIEALGNIQPSLAAAVAVFVALWAPRTSALWACLVMGLLRDLSNPITADWGRVVYWPGPYALGFVAGAWLALRLRPSLLRRRALTVGAMTFVTMLVAQAVVIMLGILRSSPWYPGGALHWSDTTAMAEMWRRALIAVYSGLLAVPAGWVLLRSARLWGFQTGQYRPMVSR